MASFWVKAPTRSDGQGYSLEVTIKPVVCLRGHVSDPAGCCCVGMLVACLSFVAMQSCKWW
jgi:hypothetical protein